MKLPRDVSGNDLVRALSRLGYVTMRQEGSHVRLTTREGGENHLTIPMHDPIKPGTLNSIIRSASAHAGLSRDEVLKMLFS